MDLEMYLHGDCHIFAKALNEVFGYRIRMAIDEYDVELEEPVLVHAYCYTGHSIVDARGILPESETLEPFDYSEVVFRDIEKAEIDQMISDEFLHPAEKGQYEALVAYLRANEGRYQVKSAS